MTVIAHVLEIGLVTVLTYPFFWLLSFSPTLKIQLHAGSRLNDHAPFVYDSLPSFMSFGALVWALSLGVLTYYSSQRCSLVPSRDAGWIAGILTVAFCGKFVLGPTAESQKRVRIALDGSFARPLSWRVLDTLSAAISNAGTRTATKLVWFAGFAAMIWLLRKVAVDLDAGELVLPAYAVLPSALLFFGRVSQTMVHSSTEAFAQAQIFNRRRTWSGPVRIAVVVLSVVSWGATMAAVEAVLKRCGAQAGSVPSLSTVISGLLAIPAITVVAGLLDSWSTDQMTLHKSG